MSETTMRPRVILKLRSSSKGFTLMELMTVLVVIGVLMAIAIPAYNSQVRKTRRAAAKTNIMEIAQAKERFHTVNNTYDGSPCVDATDYYDVACADETATTFTIEAEPTDDQTADACGTLGVNHAGTRTSEGPADCW